MEGWQENLRLVCEEMKKNHEDERSLSDRGRVVWCPDLVCGNCHSVGVFYGDDLEYGEFYECAFARYCPTCQKIYEIITGRNFAPYGSERFLPIMKKKLIANLELFQRSHLTVGTEFRPGSTGITKDEEPCLKCGGDTYTFHKDLGGIDYYDNYWTVCVNPGCNWPGRHRESYESGPY